MQLTYDEVHNIHMNNVRTAQELFIDKFVESIGKDAKNYLDKVLKPDVIDKYPELFDFSCYELALMMVKVAANHTDEHPIHRRFNKRCKEFEKIVYNER